MAAFTFIAEGRCTDMSGGSVGNHSALMDQVYRRQRHIYDLSRKYFLFGRDRAIRKFGLKPGERMIEIGCGTARNLIRIARSYPDAKLFGLDASQEMLRTARASLVHAGLDRAIALTQGYAEKLDRETFGPSAFPFDQALFSYSLSMIPDWRAALAAAAEAVKPQGTLHIVDFGDLMGMPGPARGIFRAWLRRFHVVPRSEILQTIEKAAAGAAGDLWISPARFAFTWRVSPKTMKGLLLSHVAQGSQGS